LAYRDYRTGLVEEQKSLKASKQRKLSPSSENVDVASDALVSANNT